MTDLLNEAVKRWDGWQYGDTLRDMGTMDIILEAVRLVANPNINHIAKTISDKWEMIGMIEARELAVDMLAALTPPGDTE